MFARAVAQVCTVGENNRQGGEPAFSNAIKQRILSPLNSTSALPLMKFLQIIGNFFTPIRSGLNRNKPRYYVS